MTDSKSSRRMEENPKMKISENNTLVDISVNLARVPGIWVSQPTQAQIGKRDGSGGKPKCSTYIY